MAAIEKTANSMGRSREDWQELDKEHYLHPFTDHFELGEKGTRIITRAEGVYIWDSDNNKIILNFQNVSFMSSAMIGKLVLFGKKCKTAKVALRLCNINDNVDEVFKLMRLNKVFAIDKEEETSLKKIKKK